MAKSCDPDAASTFLRDGNETGALIARFDWSATALGPIDLWPERLKAAVSMLLDSPLPMVLLWGRDGLVIYNDSYAQLMGLPHPKALGRPVREVWPEYVDFADQILDAGLAGRPTSLRNLELKVDRQGRQKQGWFDIDCSPVRDAQGEPAGVLVVTVDITERVLAERKAARKLEQQWAIFEQAPGAICLLSGPDMIVEFTNAAHKRLFGVHDAEGRPFVEAFSQIAMRGRPEVLQQVYDTGAGYAGRGRPVLFPRPDGGDEERLLDLVVEPVLDGEGKVVGLFLEAFDVTEQLHAQRAAEENARRLSAALAIARLGTFEWDAPTKSFSFDARACEILGFRPDKRVTWEELTTRIDAQDMLRIRALGAAAEAAGQTRREYEYTANLPDGSTRRVTVVTDFTVAQDGKSSRFTGVLDDVTERRAAERRQRMLINELNHRVKNTLATVQSIAAQTLRAAPNMASAREDFESRLVALAAAHDLLNAQGWHGAALADVAATAMSPFEATHRPQIAHSGPYVSLTAEQALALNLALHELATNAAKYGALSVPGGTVDVSWTVRHDELTLRWVEEGGPPVAAQAHAGFGARLLQRSLPRELGGAVEWTLATEGVRCEIRCKVQQVAAVTPVEVAEAAGLRFNF